MGVSRRSPAHTDPLTRVVDALRTENARLQASLLARADAKLHESEERYRALLEHTFDFVVEIGADGRFVHVSPGYELALGYTPDDLLGRDIFEPMHPDDVAGAREAFTRGVANRSADSAVFRYRHKNGQWRWFEGSGRPFLTSDGELRVIVCSRDITDRRRAEEDLQDELRVSAGVVRVARAMISLLHTPQVFDSLCQLTAEELGCDASITSLWAPDGDRFAAVASFGTTDEHGRPLCDLPGPIASAFAALLERDEMLESAGPAGDPLAAAVADRLGLETAVHVALKIGGRVIGMQSTGYRRHAGAFSSCQKRLAVGIAQIACMVMENARLFEKAEQANRLKSEFLATVSHELRTPLHIIIGYNDLLLSEEFGPLEAGQREILRRVARNSKELSGLIDATLDVGRLETGRASLSIGTVDVVALIAELRSETDELRHRSGLPFGWHVADDVPTVVSDAGKLKLVVKNLIANAVKFTERGVIDVDVHSREGGVAIAVSDTGIGIPPAELPHIFERFRQATTARDRGGVGLGLYIVSRTMEVLGGTVTVNSAVGRGSTFQVWIPPTPPDPVPHDAITLEPSGD